MSSGKLFDPETATANLIAGLTGMVAVVPAAVFLKAIGAPATLVYGALIFVGAFLSAMLCGVFKFSADSAVWTESFGPSKTKRLIAAFVGGIIIMYGARLADGCTSGHGISGCLQLAVSGWLFFIVMFASGILTAKLLYGRSVQA